MSDVLGGGWERRDDGAWIPRSERAHLKRRLRGALDASQPHFRAERRTAADAAKKGAKRGVEEVRLSPDSPSLRDACLDAWRGFGLTDPSQTRMLRRRAEQTLDIAQRQATGDALLQVTFLTFKLALHRVAARHVAGLRLQLADARVARGDERGALHEYKRALTEERAGWARTGRLEWAQRRRSSTPLDSPAFEPRTRRTSTTPSGSSARRTDLRLPRRTPSRRTPRKAREEPHGTISACSCARAITAPTTQPRR